VRAASSTGAGTGVTVVLAPEGTVGSAEVRGGAPATRETELLDPARLVEHVDAVVLTGGSAFGLGAADGVMRFLAERGRGLTTSAGPVPIVPAAAIFDLATSGGAYPGPDDGYAAALAAERGEPLETGRVGAGAGATVGSWKGRDHAVSGGLGSAAVHDGTAVIGALVVVNALGDIIDTHGRVLAGSTAPDDALAFPEPPLLAGEHTTLVVVATNACLTKPECLLVAQSAHLGLGRSIHPSHTRYDGDTAFALATGVVDAHLDRLRLAVVDTVAAAVRAAAGAAARAGSRPGR